MDVTLDDRNWENRGIIAEKKVEKNKLYNISIFLKSKQKKPVFFFFQAEPVSISTWVGEGGGGLQWYSCPASPKSIVSS